MRLFACVVALCVGFLTVGCSGKTATTPVAGNVKLYGRPGGNLLLMFTPTGGADGKTSFGGSATTDKDGNYTVKCDDGRDGLPPGPYMVLVTDNAFNNEQEHVPGSKGRQNRVPPKFAQLGDQNPLKVTVSATQGTYDLEVK
jgi:hypothetical protein